MSRRMRALVAGLDGHPLGVSAPGSPQTSTAGGHLGEGWPPAAQTGSMRASGLENGEGGAI